MKNLSRLVAALVAVTFTLQASAQPAQAPAPAPDSEEMQPKILIWGLLLNAAFKLASSLLADWLQNKLTVELTPHNLAVLLLNSLTATIEPLSTAADTDISAKTAGAAENAVQGEPTTPVRITDGMVNYQGVNVALIGFDGDGKPLGFRPLTAGFKSGERIKLRVLPTFDGLLVIDNINPKGQRTQVYPARASEVVKVKAGVEILVPLDKDQYFEFAGEAGDEQLVITLRDPRAFGTAAAKTPAFRQDEANGSNFVQETKPGTYPLIAQSLRLRHE